MGIRYVLISCYLNQGLTKVCHAVFSSHVQDAELVLDKFGSDGSIYFMYTCALFAYIREGASSVATNLLAQAVQLYPSMADGLE